MDDDYSHHHLLPRRAESESHILSPPSPRGCLVVNSVSTLEWREARSRLVSSSATVPDTVREVRKSSRAQACPGEKAAGSGRWSGWSKRSGRSGSESETPIMRHSVSAPVPHLPPLASTCLHLPPVPQLASAFQHPRPLDPGVLELIGTAYDKCATAYRMGS